MWTRNVARMEKLYTHKNLQSENWKHRSEDQKHRLEDQNLGNGVTSKWISNEQDVKKLTGFMQLRVATSYTFLSTGWKAFCVPKQNKEQRLVGHTDIRSEGRQRNKKIQDGLTDVCKLWNAEKQECIKVKTKAIRVETPERGISHSVVLSRWWTPVIILILI
jgi:hypothetical protein